MPDFTISWDKSTQASYIYILRVEIATTLPDFPIEILFDSDDQWIGVALEIKNIIENVKKMTISEFCNAIQESVPIFKIDQGEKLIILFYDGIIGKKFSWDSNIDLNKEGKILGIEILFPKSLHMKNKMERIQPFLNCPKVID